MKKILSILIVAIAVIAAMFILTKVPLGSAGDCLGAPILERSKCDQMNSWLDQKLIEWKPASYHQMKFGTLFPPLSYEGYRYQEDTNFSDTYLTALEPFKADILRIDLYYDAWLNNDAKRIKTIDKIIRHIGEKKYALMIADASAEQYQRKKMSWNEFRTTYLTRVRTLTEKYKPEYYVIVKEITWYDKIGNLEKKPSTEQWADLTKELARTVKEISPNTKVAVGFVPQNEKEYFYKVSEMKDVDILGFDVYDKDWSLPATEELSKYAKSKGKELWMLETWLHYLPSTGKSWKKEIDAKWIKAMVYFSQNNGFQGYVPFFAGHFFSYSEKQIEGITPAFNSYKSVIEEVRNNAR